MQVASVTFIWICIAYGVIQGAGQASHLLKPYKPASLEGRVTTLEVVNRKSQTSPMPKVRFFVFTLEDSKPFHALQQRCRRAMARPDADPVKTYQLCDQALAEAFDLVPKLPAVATGQTGRDGSFVFDDLEPGQRYQVVGIKSNDVGSPIVIEAKTATLRPGELVRLELSADDPWTGPLESR